MTNFLEILQQNESQTVLLGELKSAYETTPGDDRSAMLHAKNDRAFRVACEKGYLEIAKWLSGLCQTAEEQSAMLHAKNDRAFRVACEKGHLEIAKWLSGLCQTAEEQSAMLHAGNDKVFRVACEKGHLEIAKWLSGLCQTAEEQSAMLHAQYDCAFIVACEKGHLELAKWLWDLCQTPKDQSAMLHAKDDYAFRWAYEKGHIELAKCLMGLCHNGHIGIAKLIWGLCQTSEAYHDYFKACNKNYFINHQLDDVVKIAIKVKNPELLTNVLNGLEPTDLLEEHKLASWLSLANQEGNVLFQGIYVSSVWCGDLYQVLEKDNNATYYESLDAVIRVLFKHGVSLSTLMQQVIHDEQARSKEWWCSLFQGVIINMLTEDPNSINNYKHLLESFCEHPLVRYDNEAGRHEKIEYQERCLKIISWFESEFAKEADNPSLWPQEVLWKMLSQLCLGCGITFGDNHNRCIGKLEKCKQELKNALKESQSALDVCLERGGASYASDSASASFYPERIIEKHLQVR